MKKKQTDCFCPSIEVLQPLYINAMLILHGAVSNWEGISMDTYQIIAVDFDGTLCYSD